jgi:hypothetical protein
MIVCKNVIHGIHFASKMLLKPQIATREAYMEMTENEVLFQYGGKYG